MKSLVTMLFLLALSLTATAQSPEISSDSSVTVVKHSWSKERINWEGDPFGAPVENFEEMRRRSVDTRRVERAKGTGNVGEAAKVEREMRAEQVIKARPPKPPRYAFVYQASLRNSGAKTIKEIDWDYIFFDAVTGQELGRRQFTSVETIEPGKSKQVSFTLSKPPAQTISVYALEKKERERLREKVAIARVKYADGSVWERH